MKRSCPKNSRSWKSRFFNLRIYFVALAALAVTAMFTASGFMAAPMSGAIFTTESTCNGNNINIFGNKADVHLDGGPAHPGAAGLPDGEYYVQVTEPNGLVLGTSVGATDETPAVVSGGEFASCYQLTAILIKGSDSTAGYDTTSNGGGEYKVWVSKDPTFPGNASKTDNFKVKEEEGCEPNCNPVSTSTIRVRKYYDANANGINDDAQPIIGWKVHIQDGINYDRFTDVNIVVDPDDYTVSEYAPLETNWLNTGCSVTDNLALPTPTSAPCVPGLNTTSVTLAANDDKTVAFGNVCLGAGGGKTLGFWSNKNGEATMKDNGSLNPELSLLSSLNLVSGNSLPFDPANYAGFRSWLLSANATNMAYMLSAQLAAMQLNVESGGVSGGALVYAPCLIGSDANENSLGFISISDLMAAANASLGSNPTTVGAGPARAYQECLKTTLDRANNNLNFVQATACPFTFAE